MADTHALYLDRYRSVTYIYAYIDAIDIGYSECEDEPGACDDLLYELRKDYNDLAMPV